MLMDTTSRWLSEMGLGDYKVVNTETRSYMREDDFHVFVMFINPDLETVSVSSALETSMDYSAHKSFNRDWDEDRLYQLEYMLTILRQAMFQRKKMGLRPLSFHLNYLGDDFLEDLKSERWGWNCTSMMKLLFRQCEGLTFMLYKDFKLQKVVKSEDDLELSN